VHDVVQRSAEQQWLPKCLHLEETIKGPDGGDSGGGGWWRRWWVVVVVVMVVVVVAEVVVDEDVWC